MSKKEVRLELRVGEKEMHLKKVKWDALQRRFQKE